MSDLATNPQGDDGVRAGDDRGVDASHSASEPAEDGVEVEIEIDPDDDSADDLDGEDADDLEEVEHDGRTYRIPAALKGALMMQADYTKKTQEVAAQRHELEGMRQSFADQAEAHAAHLGEIAELTAINGELARFDAVDWQALRAQDAFQAQDLWMQYMQLKDTRDRALGTLQIKAEQRSLEMERARASQVEQAHAALTRDIKGWSPDLAGKLSDYGADFGFSTAELAAVADPRMIKVLHRAWLHDQAEGQRAARARAEATQAARPVATVGHSGPAARDPQRMSTTDWMKHRNDQVRRKRR